VTASGSISHTDCTLRVWDLDTGMLRQLLRGHMGPISCMIYDPASGRLASGSEDYTVRYWDSQAGSCVSLLDPESSVRCIHMDQSSRQLVAGTEFGRLLLWDTEVLDELLASGLQKVRIEFERTQGQGGMNGGGSRRVVVDSNNRATVLDSEEGEGKAITAIQVQNSLCATTSVEPLSTIQLWDVSSSSYHMGEGGAWSPIRTLGDANTMMFASSMSFEGHLNRLVAGCGDRSMRIWDLET
jgi:WD40 repeat protein